MTATHLHSLAIRSHRADELSEALSLLFAPVRIEPLRGGPLELDFKCSQVDGLHVCDLQTATGLRTQGLQPYEGYHLVMPSRGWCDLQLAGKQLQAGSGSSVIVDASELSHWALSPGYKSEALAISTADLEAALVALLGLPLRGRIVFDATAAMAPAAMAVLRALSGAVRFGMAREAALRHAPVAAARLRDAVVSLLLEQMPSNYSAALHAPATPLPPRHVARAIDFIHAHASAPLSVADIATAACSSVRSLQAGFQRYQHMSPVAYLRQVRLAGAREALLAQGAGPPTTVARIAGDWGFMSPSAFAALYRDAYGEPPSDTLKFGRRQAD